MGLYLNTPVTTGKADWLLQNIAGAQELEKPSFLLPDDRLCIFVVENGGFDAAAVAYDKEVFDHYKGAPSRGDTRVVRYLSIPYEECLKLVARPESLTELTGKGTSESRL